MKRNHRYSSGVIDLTPALQFKRFNPSPEPRSGKIAIIVATNLIWLCAAWILLQTGIGGIQMGISKTHANAQTYLTNFVESYKLRRESLSINAVASDLRKIAQDDVDTLELAMDLREIIMTAPKGPRRDFVANALAQGMHLQDKYAIPASAVVGMSIYESFYGQSELSREAHNYHGLKGFGWDGEVVWKVTRDFNRTVTHRQPFRKFASMDKGFEGYAHFLTQNSRYINAFQYDDGPSFVQAVASAGYCPDGDYTAQVIKIMDRHQLTRLDRLYRNHLALRGKVAQVSKRSGRRN